MEYVKTIIIDSDPEATKKMRESMPKLYDTTNRVRSAFEMCKEERERDIKEGRVVKTLLYTED